ncbi:MAG: isoprenylcysteine carboxylmethyltransferase family protein [Anaerolineae bacterium]|nr:isoprenylcysteine carboxylmethyltransferase family protein [Anaerolineae bacterium]
MFWVPLLTIVVYGVLHSLLASPLLKRRIRATIGERAYEGFYRLAYNILSAVLLAPVILVLLVTPSQEVWRIPMPWAAACMLIQAGSLIALIVAVLQADPLRFAGISQALAYLRHEPLPPESLQVQGFYGLVRHPLYLFSLLVLWPSPIMTDTLLGVAVGATLYLLLGSRLEERRLAAEFGEAYTAYRRRVPWLLPWPRPRNN